VYLHRIEDVREMKAVPLTFLVEWALDVEERIVALNACAGVPEDE